MATSTRPVLYALRLPPGRPRRREEDPSPDPCAALSAPAAAFGADFALAVPGRHPDRRASTEAPRRTKRSLKARTRSTTAPWSSRPASSYRHWRYPSGSLAQAGVFYEYATTQAQALAEKRAFIASSGGRRRRRCTCRSTRSTSRSSSARRRWPRACPSTWSARSRPLRHRRPLPHQGRAPAAMERLEQLSLPAPGRRRYPAPSDGLFVLIGARPAPAGWPEADRRDQWGCVTSPTWLTRWTCDRKPFLLENQHPRRVRRPTYRHGSVKHMASAISNRSIAIHLAHDYLALALDKHGPSGSTDAQFQQASFEHRLRHQCSGSDPKAGRLRGVVRRISPSRPG